MVLRLSAALLAALLLLMASCKKDIRSKEKVQEAIVKRLETRSGLDLKSLDITTTSVSFDKNMAYATVAFHPKADSRLNSGMSMRYTLEDRDGKWVVVKVGDSHGHGLMDQTPNGAEQLPPGHPPVNRMNPQSPAPQGTPMGHEGANGPSR